MKYKIFGQMHNSKSNTAEKLPNLAKHEMLIMLVIDLIQQCYYTLF